VNLGVIRVTDSYARIAYLLSVKVWKKLNNKPSANIPGKNRELSESTALEMERIISDLDYQYDGHSQ
jgi:hypothetical protein